MKTLATSALAPVSTSIASLNAAPISVAA